MVIPDKIISCTESVSPKEAVKKVRAAAEKVAENKLLVFMLRRGYIDEKYANYINYFKGTSITKEDMNLISTLNQNFRYHPESSNCAGF